MLALDAQNPYAGNILADGLGAILSPAEFLKRLTYVPELPGSLSGVPFHIRLHHLMSVLDLHLPPLVERQLAQTIDLMVRQGYRTRDPRLAQTWSSLSGEGQRHGIILPSASVAAVEGLPGVGKTQGCLRCLRCFPRQVIDHAAFPQLVGGLRQVVWLSVEVPPSGSAPDLARTLMRAWDDATGGNRFAYALGKAKSVDPMRELDEWHRVASSHFLGILHLDEIQNLFKLATLRQRKDRKPAEAPAELSIVEDRVLRWLLYLSNNAQPNAANAGGGPIPLLFSGTPDGIGALTKRMSTIGRVGARGGYHPFEPFDDPLAPEFIGTFLPTLGRSQYVVNKIEIDAALASLIVELTAGVQRFIMALWIAAHRIAFERRDDRLCLEDFTMAASTYLAPLAPLVAAIRSKDSVKLARYDDLVRRDTVFWAKFWSGMGAPL